MAEDLGKRPVLYDLSVKPTTFDFACTAVIAKTLGYKSVHFAVGKPIATWKYPAVVGWRRWANIVIPICSLAGLDFSVGCEALGDELSYTTGGVVDVYNKLGRIEKLVPVLQYKDKDYITITLRQSFRNTWRNSNKHAWQAVKEWLERRGQKVLVLGESEAQPMGIEHRMGIYCNAKMNLSVGNGPMVLCWLSEAPYLSFQLPDRMGREKEYDTLIHQWNNMGFPVGSQLPWKTEKQEIVWGPDDYETITTYCEKYLDLTNEKAEAQT